VAGDKVTVIDATGKSVSATSDANGNYAISLSGLTAPFLIAAVDPTGVNPTLFSVVDGLPTGSTTPVVANVTTLTSAVAALLTQSGNPLDLSTATGVSTQVNASAVAAAKTVLRNVLTPILSANGLSVASFDPVAEVFTANQTGADAVIDAVHVVAAPAGGSELISTAAPSSAISLNQSTTASTPLAAPPVSATYLSTLTTQLRQCLSGSSTACSQVIDAKYLEHGYTTFAAAHTALGTSGTVLGTPQTLEFITTASGTLQALVALPYTTAGGATGTSVTVAQQLPGGAWDLIGDQQPFDVTITSFLARRQFLDTADAPYGRYEAGIDIDIPVGVAGSSNPSNLTYASVTGPGITGTAYLMHRNAVGSNILGLTSHFYTALPPLGLTTFSNTSLYRWSWQALPGATATYVPASNALGYYPPTPISATAVPQFASYTVTFYDATGAVIQQPFTVINPSPIQGAAAGAGVAWQSLSTDSQNAVMSPTGTQAAAQATVSLSWSTLINNQALAAPVSRAQILTYPGTGATSSIEVDAWWVSPGGINDSGQYTATFTAGLDQNGVQQCTSSCSFDALQAGAMRTVELSWTVGKLTYYNLWKYID
jgi:hypothetical protein